MQLRKAWNQGGYRATIIPGDSAPLFVASYYHPPRCGYGVRHMSTSKIGPLNPCPSCPLFPTHTHPTTGRGSSFCMTLGDGHLALLVSVRVDSSVLGQNRSKETNYMYISIYIYIYIYIYMYIYIYGKLFDSLKNSFFSTLCKT